jgi:hypothetical protein
MIFDEVATRTTPIDNINSVVEHLLTCRISVQECGVDSRYPVSVERFGVIQKSVLGVNAEGHCLRDVVGEVGVQVGVAWESDEGHEILSAH